MHTFYLTKRNAGGSMTSDNPNEDSKRYLESYSVPSFDLIPDPRPNAKGKTYIANIYGEKSAFVDEQSDPHIIQKIKSGEFKVPKIQFTEGRRLVEDHDTVEYQYLQLCRWNENNKPNNRTRTFFEFKPQEVSKKKIDTEMEDIKIKSEILNLSATKLAAVARVSGALANSKNFDTIEPSILQHSLVVKVSNPQGKQLVKEILEDPMLEPRYDILEALDKNILKWHPTNEWNLIWSSGGVVCNVPAGTQDKHQYAAEYLYHKGRETLNTVRSMLGRKMVSQEEVEAAVEGEAQALREFVKNATNAEIVEKMIEWNKENPEHELFRLNGSVYLFGDKQLSTEDKNGKTIRGKDGIRVCLTEDINLFNMAYAEWSKLIF